MLEYFQVRFLSCSKVLLLYIETFSALPLVTAASLQHTENLAEPISTSLAFKFTDVHFPKACIGTFHLLTNALNCVSLSGCAPTQGEKVQVPRKVRRMHVQNVLVRLTNSRKSGRPSVEALPELRAIAVEQNDEGPGRERPLETGTISRRTRHETHVLHKVRELLRSEPSHGRDGHVRSHVQQHVARQRRLRHDVLQSLAQEDVRDEGGEMQLQVRVVLQRRMRDV